MRCWGMESAQVRCQSCGTAAAMDDDVLCAVCAGAVQLSWGIAHSRGPQRGDAVRWDGRRRSVVNVDLQVDLL